MVNSIVLYSKELKMDHRNQSDFHLMMRYEEEYLHKYYGQLLTVTNSLEPSHKQNCTPSNNSLITRTELKKNKQKVCGNQVNAMRIKPNISINSRVIGKVLPFWLEAEEARTIKRLSGNSPGSGIDSKFVTAYSLVDKISDTPVPPKQKKSNEKPSVPAEIEKNSMLRKYWLRRFILFSKFDQGIKLDKESWYSVTPEQVAKDIAERCKCNVIVDAFCGAGGNTIQFALTCSKVIAIDIDPKKIELARNNAQVYGVAHKIHFIVGDFLQLSNKLKAEAVFLSPPWGGPSYVREPVYDLEEMLQPVPWSKLLVAARKVSSNIAAFLPKNSNTKALTREAGSDSLVEIEKSFSNKRLIAITAYYNDLVKKR